MSSELNDKIEEIYRNQNEKDLVEIKENRENRFGKFIDKAIFKISGHFTGFFQLMDPRVKKIKEDGYEYFLLTRDIFEAVRQTIVKILHL